jgi:hypothetical protein
MGRAMIKNHLARKKMGKPGMTEEEAQKYYAMGYKPTSYITLDFPAEPKDEEY